MGKNKLELFRYHRKRRNIIFLSLLGTLFVAGGLFLTLYLLDIDENIIMPLAIVFLVVFTLFVVKYRQRINYHSMFATYYRMLNDDLGLLKCSRKLFTPSWLDSIKTRGFNKTIDHQDFQYFYQNISKLKEPIFSKALTLYCIIAKGEDFDFYSEQVDEEMQRSYIHDDVAKKANVVVVLQFKKYSHFTPEAKEEVDKIINFKTGKNVLLHLTIGYFVEENSIYYLRPKTKYPHKYYYYAVKTINDYCGIIDKE